MKVVPSIASPFVVDLEEALLEVGAKVRLQLLPTCCHLLQDFSLQEWRSLSSMRLRVRHSHTARVCLVSSRVGRILTGRVVGVWCCAHPLMAAINIVGIARSAIVLHVCVSAQTYTTNAGGRQRSQWW